MEVKYLKLLASPLWRWTHFHGAHQLPVNSVAGCGTGRPQHPTGLPGGSEEALDQVGGVDLHVGGVLDQDRPVTHSGPPPFV